METTGKTGQQVSLEQLAPTMRSARDSGLMQEIGRRIQTWLYDYLELIWKRPGS